MPRYLVNSAILRSGKDPRACAEGAAKMLAKGKIKDVEAKSCFAVPQKAEWLSSLKEQVKTLCCKILQEQMDIPVASIFEVEEVTPKK